MGNEMMRAKFVRLDDTNGIILDSTFVTTFDTVWRFDTPYRIAHSGVYAPTTSFGIHLSKDDSVVVYYLDRVGSAIGKPFKVFLQKGTYRYELDPFALSSGVYLNICLIGNTKWTKKILLVR